MPTAWPALIYPSLMCALACEESHPVAQTKDATYSTDAVEHPFLPWSAPRAEAAVGWQIDASQDRDDGAWIILKGSAILAQHPAMSPQREVEQYPFGTQRIGGSKDFREDANP